MIFMHKQNQLLAQKKKSLIGFQTAQKKNKKKTLRARIFCV
jgi:hypothetical protein